MSGDTFAERCALSPAEARVRVSIAGTLVCDSTSALSLKEGAHPVRPPHQPHPSHDVHVQHPLRPGR